MQKVVTSIKNPVQMMIWKFHVSKKVILLIIITTQPTQVCLRLILSQLKAKKSKKNTTSIWIIMQPTFSWITPTLDQKIRISVKNATNRQPVNHQHCWVNFRTKLVGERKLNSEKDRLCNQETRQRTKKHCWLGQKHHCFQKSFNQHWL